MQDLVRLRVGRGFLPDSVRTQVFKTMFMKNAYSLMTIISANFVVWKISNEFRSRYFDIWTVPDSMVRSVLQDSAPKIKFGIRDLLCDGTMPFSPAELCFLYLRVDTAFES